MDLTAAREGAKSLPYRGTPRPRVRVLDEDPDLGAGLAPEDWQEAAAAALAPVFVHPAGRWQFSAPVDKDGVGLLVLTGVILIRVDLGERAHIDVLGEGDVISPWTGLGPDLAVRADVSSSVVSDLRAALLDRSFIMRTARWPEIQAALMQRLIARSRRLSLQSAINGLTRTEERVELTLWQLASRFGKVTRDGYKLSLRLTHNQLAEIVAAQRPSVTTALVRLEQAGRLHRNHDEWILPGEPPPRLKPLAGQRGLP
jgi:CRP/FNR family transcriptional regulator, cyclic AMP receptor protein